MNYMDYTDDVGMNMFTIGQAVRMLATLTGPRSSLLQSDALVCFAEEARVRMQCVCQRLSIMEIEDGSSCRETIISITHLQISKVNHKKLISFILY